MKIPTFSLLSTTLLMLFNIDTAHSAPTFFAPTRGFISEQPAKDWQEGLLTGNGTMGAIVKGNPYDETLYLSHASLYLPYPTNPNYINMASRLEQVRQMELAGNYAGAAGQINEARKDTSYADHRDPFIAAFALHVRQPESKVVRYQRAVNFMTSETSVSVADELGSFERNAFVSRPDNVVVLRLRGSGKQTAEFSFAALPAANENQKETIAKNIKSSEQGTKGGYLYFRTLFTHSNPYNPNRGYEGLGKVISKGGTRTETATGIKITDAKEILLLVKIQPLLVATTLDTNVATLKKELDVLKKDYSKLLASQAKVQSDLMGRVSFSLEAPVANRAKTSEQLNADSMKMDAPLAKIERAFDAGRYNILCSTGLYPPNLQGLWSGTWSAPWSGSFTVNGNLPSAIAFLLMGNTPELMEPYFRYYDERMPGFRKNARALYGMRGFHVPAQLTVSPLEIDFSRGYPHNFWHAGAAWACQFYYDYYQYTGDKTFLAERAYPMMKEAAAFYEDFLTISDANGRFVFVPSYSPENAPTNTREATAINATMDISAAKQLLRNAITTAKLLGRDADLQAKWQGIIAKLPDYEVATDGSFREWLWAGLEENNKHRHASQLYALYDEMPAEIVDNPVLVKAVEHTVRERLNFQKRTGEMAFGVVQLGLASAHINSSELTQETINFLAKGYWSSGMASFHNRGNLFNMDISGGFPYLCSSALVYSESGHIRFFPARPAQWQRGSIKGIRLRGDILLRELSWEGSKAKAVLVSDTKQTVSIETSGGKTERITLRAGHKTTLNF